MMMVMVLMMMVVVVVVVMIPLAGHLFCDKYCFKPLIYVNSFNLLR